MVYRRGNGFHPLTQLRDEMERLASGYFRPAGGAQETSRWNALARSFPSLNVWEHGDALFVEAEVPGLKSDDIDISVVGSDLTIRGSRETKGEEGVAYHRRERSSGQFNRVLRLPVEVDGSKVEATLTHGVLLVKLPKAESAKPRKIKIN
jgi:HSP20 family protein